MFLKVYGVVNYHPITLGILNILNSKNLQAYFYLMVYV